MTKEYLHILHTHIYAEFKYDGGGHIYLKLIYSELSSENRNG